MSASVKKAADINLAEEAAEAAAALAANATKSTALTVSPTQSVAKPVAEALVESPTESLAAPRTGSVLDVEVPQSDKIPFGEMLRKLIVEQKRSWTKLLGEIIRLSRGPGKVSSEEYFRFRLFDDEALEGRDKGEFLGNLGCKQVAEAVNYDHSWFRMVTDKLTFAAVTAGFGLPSIAVKGFYSEDLDLPAMNTLKTRGALLAFLREPANYPLFGKPTGGSLSLGTIGLDSFDADTDTAIAVTGEGVAVTALADDIVVNYSAGYLLQERLTPHFELFEIYGNRTGAIRIYTIWNDRGPEVFRAVWKLPAGKNNSDNFWRTGNMMAQLDVQTGTIIRVIQGAGFAQVVRDDHPDSGFTLKGYKLPLWDEVTALALRASRVFHGIKLIGWDIALTSGGPRLIEANTAPDFGLVQMAEMRGAYDDRLKAFVAEQKAIVAGLQNKRKQRRKKLRKHNVKRSLRSVTSG